MPRSAAQSDFSVARPAQPQVELPPGAAVVALPDAPTHEASALATRWVMRATFFLLLVLVLLCAVGLHMPSGE